MFEVHTFCDTSLSAYARRNKGNLKGKTGDAGEGGATTAGTKKSSGAPVMQNILRVGSYARRDPGDS